MDHNEPFQDEEFDLESILNEFHDPANDPPAEEAPPAPMPELTPEPAEEAAPGPDAELENLRFPAYEAPVFEAPVLAAAPAEAPVSEAPAEAPAEAPVDPALAGSTVRFTPLGQTEEPPAPPLDSTQVFSGEFAQAATFAPGFSTEGAPAEAAPAAPVSAVPPEELSQPAFEVEEEFIPAPSVFTPKSRLRELKKKLVAGPEKRYYALSEIGVGKLQAAILVSLILALLCGGAAAMYTLDLVPENRQKLLVFSQVLAMLIAALLGSQLLLDAIGELFTKFRFTLNTLLLVTFGVCVADAVFCLREQRVPCCGAFCLEMTMALWARYQKRNTELAQLDTMRKAVRLHGLVKTENYLDGQPGIQRVEGEVEDFMDTYQAPTGPEKVQNAYALIALLASAAIAVLAGMKHGTSLALQVMSTTLLAAVPASFFIATSRPMAILEQRLHMVGTVLCGWKGVKALSGKAVFPLQDEDLFPQGSAKLNGVKFYGSRDPDEVVAMTTSLIRAAGGGLAPVFQQLLKNRGGSLLAVSNFRDYGEGGIGGVVRGEPVLVGTLDFLQDMNIEIPEGTKVSQAVYAAVDGQLAAVYAISYAKMRSSTAGLVTLCGYRKLTPLVLCTDFVLTEEFLRGKFGLKSQRIRFPDKDTRAELLKKQPAADAPVLALVTREELISTAYAVTGSRALRTAANLGVAIHLVGGILGIVIMLVLAILGSTELLTPTNVLLYQLVWAVPGILVTEWTRTV